MPRFPKRGAAILMAALTALVSVRTANAANPMGYRLLTQEQAAQLPHNHGVLGVDVDRGGFISDDGLNFEVMHIKTVKSGSPGQLAGLRAGDDIIAIDGQVFPSIAAFAAYVGSLPPGSAASFDTIPAGAGPGQAERLSVRIGPNEHHLSTGAKLAIGAGAVAILGCYELGCFSHRQAPPRQQSHP